MEKQSRNISFQIKKKIIENIEEKLKILRKEIIKELKQSDKL